MPIISAEGASGLTARNLFDALKNHDPAALDGEDHIERRNHADALRPRISETHEVALEFFEAERVRAQTLNDDIECNIDGSITSQFFDTSFEFIA